MAEAYSFDSISMMGYLARATEQVEIGSAIVNVYSRTATLLAMTFAGPDYVSGGRAICGLGASGPQVIEGFHGVAYERPMRRIRETIEVCRQVWKREVIDDHGQTIDIPLPAGEGTGLGTPLKLINHPVRDSIPIWWASLEGRSVESTAELADGWLPVNYIPRRRRSPGATPSSLASTALVGPLGFVKERVAAYAEAGVTHLSLGLSGSLEERVAAVATMRKVVDEL